MVELSERDKARIRAEEEARVQAEAEQAYREQVRAQVEAERAYREEVRAELKSAQPPPARPRAASAPAAATFEPEPEPEPAPARPARSRSAPAAPAAVLEPEPEPEPAPARPARSRSAPAAPAAASRRRAAPGTSPPRPGGGTAWWVAAGVALVGGAALIAVAFSLPAGAGGADAEDEGGEALDPPAIVASGAGALAPHAPARWEAAALGAEGFEVGDDGVVRSVAPTPMRSFADLERAAGEGARPRQVVLPEPPPVGTPPPEPAPGTVGLGPAAVGQRAADAPSFDPLLRFVPPDAWLVVGFDGAALRSSAPLSRILAAFVGQTGAAPTLAGWAEEGVVRAPADLTLAVLAWLPVSLREAGEGIVALTGAFDGARALALFAAANPGSSRVVGPPVDVVDTGYGGVALAEGGLVLAGPESLRAALAARVGNGALLSPELGAPLRAARTAPAAFAVLRVDEALGATGPLATVRRVVARLDVAEGLAVDLAVTAVDAAAAASLLVAVEGARAEAPPALAPLFARATVRVDGATLTLSLRATAVEAEALLAELGVPSPR